MTAADQSATPRPTGLLPITPLRKTNENGDLYTRPPKIEAKLAELAALSREEVLEMCKIRQWNDPSYIPSECVLYLVRACREDDRSVYFERLYTVLAERVFQSLPKAEGGGGKTLSLTASRIREAAFDKFVEMLVGDRSVYAEKLDYYEVRFNHAMAAMRADAQREILPDAKRSALLEVDQETGVLSGKVERADESFDPFNPAKLRSADYRSSLDAAIDALTPDHRRIVEMIRLEIPIDSQEPNVLTISKVLKKSEKTIRTYRDEAYAHLQAWLTKGEVL